MALRFLIAAGKFAHLEMTLAALLLCLLCLSPTQSLAASALSEPVDIAALRESQARSATDLRQQAIKLRSTAKDRKTPRPQQDKTARYQTFSIIEDMPCRTS